MSRRRVVITIPPDAYHRLVELAEAEERAVDQQASLLLKRVLAGVTGSVAEVSPELDAANQGDADTASLAAVPTSALS